LEIQPLEKMPAVIGQTGANLGILAVPADAAQAVAEEMVAAGIKGILNFAPAVLRLPDGVSLVAVDLAVQLEQLAFLVHLED
jgi:redox-sensing transcriptional repressor